MMELCNVNKYAEAIARLEATRKAKADRMEEIQQLAIGEGRSKNTAEKEEFDALKRDVAGLDSELVDVRGMAASEEADAATARTVDTVVRQAMGRTPVVQTVGVKKQEQLKPGIAFARYAMCLMAAKGNHAIAHQLATKHFGDTEAVVQVLKSQAEGANIGDMIRMKAAVAAGTTSDSTWAAPLVYAQNFTQDFISFLRARSLLGQADFSPIPFNVRVPKQTSGGTAYWVGQGKPKPVTKMDFGSESVPFTKVAAIAVITQELARFSDPSAETIVRDTIADAVIEKEDQSLFSQDAAVSGVSPAGLLSGVNPVAGPPASGVDAEEIRCALLRLWAPWDSTYLGTRPAYYTTPAVARALAFKRDALGNPAFPGMTPQGGTLDGVPVRVSQYLANAGGSGGAPLILVDEREIWLARDPNVTLDASEQTALQMDDAPTNTSGPTGSVAATSMVSMWQTNSIALRAEQFVWFGPRRSGAVQWIDGFPTSC